MVAHKGARDKRVWKVVNRHGVVVDVKNRVDIQLFLSNFLLTPGFSSEGAHLEFSVINIHSCKIVSRGILLDLLELDIAVILSSEMFFKSFCVSLKRVLVDYVLSITFTSYGDR